MNESIFLRYRRAGVDVPVTAFAPHLGIQFANETSAPRMRFFFSMTPGPVAERQLEHVRRVEDWDADDLRVRGELADGGIRLRGGGTVKPAESLPPGAYTIRLGLEDTKLKETSFPIDIPRGGEVAITVEEKVERRFTFNNDPNFEPVTFGILSNRDSVLDRMPAVAWLGDPLRRIARKACLLNVMAKLRHLGLAPHVDSVNFAAIDRIYTRVSPSLFDTLHGNPGYREETSLLHATHINMALDRLGSAFSNYDLVSFRENVGKRSLQVIVAKPNSSDQPMFAEMDIDLGNPGVDAASFIIHVGELLDPGRTNHVALYDKLRNDGLDDFLYYKLEKAQSAGSGD